MGGRIPYIQEITGVFVTPQLVFEPVSREKIVFYLTRGEDKRTSEIHH